MGPPGDGEGIDEALEELAAKVAAGGRGPDQPGVLLASADSRRAVAVFHVFTAAERDQVPTRAEFLAQYAMEEADTDRCIVFAPMLKRWDLPFTFSFWAEAADEI